MMDQIIKLLDVVIWPVTLLSIIVLFKAQFKSVFSRVKDFQANTSGLSMSFSEKLEATKKLASKIGPNAVAKSAHQISPNSNLVKLKSWEGEVKNYLILKGENANIDIENKSIEELNELLKEKGILKFNKAQLITAFGELSESATDNITDEQLNDVNEIVQLITS